MSMAVTLIITGGEGPNYIPVSLDYDFVIASDSGYDKAKELNIEVIMQDERLTTVEATHYMLEGNVRRAKRKEKIKKLKMAVLGYILMK